MFFLAFMIACTHEQADSMLVGGYCAYDNHPAIRWQTASPIVARVSYVSAIDPYTYTEIVAQPWSCVEVQFLMHDCDDGLAFMDTLLVASSIVPDCIPGTDGEPWSSIGIDDPATR